MLPYSESNAYVPRQFPVEPDKSSKNKKGKDPVPVPRATPSPEQMPGSGPEIKESSPITIPVSVFNADGIFVGDLKQDDFKVYVDGNEVQITSVERRNEPLNVLLVLDTSPSSAQTLDATKKLALNLIDKFPSDDRISVFQFNEVLKQLSPLAPDHQVHAKAISKLKMGDGTSLYEIMGQLAKDFIATLSGRTVVILVTDGVDTTSTKSTYSASLVAAEMSGASVYPVYLDTFSQISSPPKNINGIYLGNIIGRPIGNGSLGSTENDYKLGKLYLNDLVFLSGGRAVAANSLMAGTSRVAASIAEEAHEQYYITFAPVGSAFTGQRKHIKVRVARPELAVIARGSYIVGSPPSKTSSQ